MEENYLNSTTIVKIITEVRKNFLDIFREINLLFCFPGLFHVDLLQFANLWKNKIERQHCTKNLCHKLLPPIRGLLYLSFMTSRTAVSATINRVVILSSFYDCSKTTEVHPQRYSVLSVGGMWAPCCMNFMLSCGLCILIYIIFHYSYSLIASAVNTNK